MKKKEKQLRILDPVTMFCPKVEGAHEAMIYTVLFDGDNAITKLTINYN